MLGEERCTRESPFSVVALPFLPKLECVHNKYLLIVLASFWVVCYFGSSVPTEGSRALVLSLSCSGRCDIHSLQLCMYVCMYIY